jgi:hypothetical protein
LAKAAGAEMVATDELTKPEGPMEVEQEVKLEPVAADEKPKTESEKN